MPVVSFLKGRCSLLQLGCYVLEATAICCIGHKCSSIPENWKGEQKQTITITCNHPSHSEHSSLSLTLHTCYNCERLLAAVWFTFVLTYLTTSVVANLSNLLANLALGCCMIGPNFSTFAPFQDFSNYFDEWMSLYAGVWTAQL